MADGTLSKRNIYIDLNAQTAARVIRAAGTRVRIKAIRINGVAGAGVGDIFLREGSAAGDIFFQAKADPGDTFDGGLVSLPLDVDGVYMDALTSIWAARAHMMIYTD